MMYANLPYLAPRARLVCYAGMSDGNVAVKRIAAGQVEQVREWDFGQGFIIGFSRLLDSQALKPR